MPARALRLLYVVNIPRFFLSHRLPLALAARAGGYDVHVAAADGTDEERAAIAAAGLAFHPLPLSQHGTTPWQELRTILALRALYARVQPDLLHLVSIKPVLYGGMAARLRRAGPVVHAMSGLGYLFVDGGRRAKLLARIVQPALRWALAGENSAMIFQNVDDCRVFVERGIIARQRCTVIRGSGVDERYFQPQPELTGGKPVVLFAGRLLWKKGLGEFVQAARQLRGRARFVVVGYEERSSPHHVPAAQLRAWAQEGCIEWAGKRDDMPRVYAESHIVCLPSSYGEGVPKVLIEAAACARACVSTDSPGCRDIVRQGENGLLVPVGDSVALVAALERLIEDGVLRRAMGARGREIVLAGFTQRHVHAATFALYRKLLGAV